MKFAQFEEWMLWYILWKFQIREQSSFLNVLYNSALETKVYLIIIITFKKNIMHCIVNCPRNSKIALKFK